MEFLKIVPADKFYDTKSCALIATSHALELPYKTVYTAYYLAGRERHKGSTLRQIDNSVQALLQAYKGHDKPKQRVQLSMTLEKFAKLYPKGRYIVIKSEHALALIDGVYFDTFEPKPKARVKSFYKIS